MSDVTIGLGLFTGQRPAGATDPDYRAAPRLAAAAEAAGFDAFWVSEHHGWADDYIPAPLPVLAAVAAVTDRILLGTGLALAPLYHPVALAEQAAVVDHLSGGRLVLGLGLGYVDSEFRAFGVDRSHRGRGLEQLVSFLRAAWTGEAATWTDAQGQSHTAVVRPRPHQEQIPIWLGGYAPAALERAGRIADGYLIGRADPDVLADASHTIAHHRDPAGGDFTFGLNVITVLDDDRSSPTLPLEALARQQAAYEAVQRRDDPFAGRFDVGEEARALALGSVDRYVHARGTPDQVVATMTDLVETVADWTRIHVVVRTLFPEADVSEQIDRIHRLGTEVLPRLRTIRDSPQRR